VDASGRSCKRRMKTHPLSSFARTVMLCLAVHAGVTALHAQQGKPPHIGYIFPAGVQRGTACEMVVGGEFLEGTKEMLVGSDGIKVTMLQYKKPLPGKRAAELREYLQEARKKFMEAKEKPAAGMERFNRAEVIASILKEAGATDEEITAFEEMRKQNADPKRQQNLQIAETVTLKIEVAANAPTGSREMRLLTPAGASNPLSFCVGSLPEQRKIEPLGKTVETAMRLPIPSVINGQILPGGVDHYAFQARRGAHLVVAVQARDLIPYLADAVPGWFQPVAALYDAKGKEVGYANNFRFNPDPVLCCEVPEDGVYLLEIRDALYRGREDFVYRITVGEVPFVTGIFPLGGRVRFSNAVNVAGWNLAHTRVILNPVETEGIHPLADLSNGLIIGGAEFESDALPEMMEQEPNNEPKQAQRVVLPVIVNGHIDTPGDIDVFAFVCGPGAKVVAEVTARRLNSPLDSWLKVTDATGRQIAFNDDREDKGAPLLTHQADSYLTFTAPTGGLYYLTIGDAQRKGGPEYAYRLRISAPRPDYALRLAPSCLNVRPGDTMPVTVYALRRDGFAGDITLHLKGAPAGVVMSGGVIPGEQDKVRATLTFPMDLGGKPLNLALEGHAIAEGRDITHPVVPADDMLQAFAYHHLVPANELLAILAGSPRGRPPMNIVGSEAKLPVGGTGKVGLATPGRSPFAVGELIQFQLREPPEGISIEGEPAIQNGVVEITFRTDASKVKPGLRGNLIIEGFAEKTMPTQEGKPPEKKRWSIGYLPAIPFKVVEH